MKKMCMLFFGLLLVVPSCAQNGTRSDGNPSNPDQSAHQAPGLQKIGILAKGME